VNCAPVLHQKLSMISNEGRGRGMLKAAGMRIRGYGSIGIYREAGLMIRRKLDIGVREGKPLMARTAANQERARILCTVW
jgi:hypothetical protein